MIKKNAANKNIKAPTNKIIKKNSFPIVVIGASAGGLEAVSQLFKYLPINTGMVFFYIQHLSPNHQSYLPELLSKTTKIKVHEAKNGMEAKPDNIYVCTPNKEITLIGGKIKLTQRHAEKLPYLPIDDFFSSLVKNYKNRVVGIILSGNATDGTKGLKAIKEAGGLTFAQDRTAKYSSMPKSAIKEGAVEFVLSPKEIASKLDALAKNNFVLKGTVLKNNVGKIADNDPNLKAILEILYNKLGVDFSHYKMATIKRRLDYRMIQCNTKSVNVYLKLLLKKNNEVELLYKDLLINVTSFFRDIETFKYLKLIFLPKLLKSKGPDETLRIWVAACSTGEEVYSIAMLLLDLQMNKTVKNRIQIFATDLSDKAIVEARKGEYSLSDVKPIGEDLLKRFFTKTGTRYRVSKELREMCVFAPQNILSDPPFSRIDFISCRNLLIYFDTAAQKRALSMMNFALNDVGFLMLGKSESTGVQSHFNLINTKFKIYSRKKFGGTRKISELTPRFHKTTISTKTVIYDKKVDTVTKKPLIANSKELDNAIDSILIEHYMPACAIINKNFDILKFRGSTSLFLSHQSGNANLNILKMTSPEFSFELRNSIHKAFKSKQIVIKRDLEIKIGSGFKMMSLEVHPLKVEWDEPLLLIIFTLQEHEEKYIETRMGGKNTSTQKDRRIKKLLEELNDTRSEMHSIIESQESALEELQAANEEIVSTNEEFQTLNEELETTKEEIEASNEELVSTNQELQTRNNLLSESYKYSEAIIATIHEPMIILDSHLHVRSANKEFYRKFRVTKEETEGVSLYELGNEQWNITQLRKLLHDIVSKNIDFKNFEIKHTFPGIGEKIMLLNAQRIVQKTHGEQLILLAIEDITERTRNYLKEKEILNKDILEHKADKLELEKAVRRRTRQLQQKNVELENANKDLTSFTYVSSHDLQEPLRKIRNFISVLLEEEKKKLSNDGKGYLQRTYDTAQRMQALIEDLLAYSRTKNLERKFEKTDLNILLDEVKIDYDEVIKKKKAIIKANNLCEVNIIRFQFRQLLHNLISNSLKFSKSKIAPRIEIKSEKVHGSKLNAGNFSAFTGMISAKINYCHITYTDNGIGFDPQYNERIFEVFQRLHSQEKYEGTGMGLAICKRIVENHNGIITAAGKSNHGVTFDIYIPA